MSFSYSNPIHIEWIIDGGGNKVSLPVVAEQKVVVGNMIVLDYIPDYTYRVTCNSATPVSEIEYNETITTVDQYKVDYNMGTVYVHSSLDGDTLSFDYYKRGVIYYPDTRIYSELSGGSVTKTLAGLVSELTTDSGTITTRIDNHVDGSAELHDDSDINNTTAVTGAKVSDAITNLKAQLDGAVISASNASIGVYSVNVSGTNTLTATFASLTYFDKLKMNLKIANSNTGGVTLNVNSLGAKNVYKIVNNVKTALDARDLKQGTIVSVEYDGTDFIVIDAEVLEYESAESSASIISLPSTAQGFMSEVEVRGKTRTNALTDATADTTDDTLFTAVTCVLDDSSVGLPDGIQITTSAPSTAGTAYVDILPQLDITKYYLLTCELKNGNQTNGIRFFVNCIGDVGVVTSSYITATTLTRVGILLQPSDFDGASAVNMAIQTDGVATQYAYFRKILATEITATEYALGATTLMQQIPWHLGTKSVAPMALISNGKNLFDKDKVTRGGYIDNNNAWVVNSAYVESEYIQVKTSSTYVNNLASSQYIKYYTDDKTFISSAVWTSGTTITTPSNCGYIRYSATLALYEGLQLELGSTATDYEPFQKTQAICPVPLRSTSATITDKWYPLLGKVVQNIEMYVLTEDDITAFNNSSKANFDYFQIPFANLANSSVKDVIGSLIIVGFTDVADISSTLFVDDSIDFVGKHDVYISSTHITCGVTAETYADLAAVKTALAGTTVYYQLATPVTTYYQPSNLLATASGTLYQSPFIADYGFYNSGLALTDSNYPIANLLEVRKWDLTASRQGSFIKIPISDCTVTAGVITAITDAVDGEFYSYEYDFEYLSTNATIDYEYPVNMAGQVESIKDGVVRLEDRIENVEDQLTIGVTADVAVAKVGGGTRTLSFINGLYTGYVDS